MDNKNPKYLLFLAVIAIWGLFGYRLYDRTRPKGGIGALSNKDVASHQPTGNVDSFSLLLGYKDPFTASFSSYRQKVKTPKKEKPKPAKEVKKKAPPKPFPTIVYKGNLKLKTGRTVALVAIENQNAHMEEGETFKEVRLTKIFGDSIRVRYLKEKKTVLKVRL